MLVKYVPVTRSAPVKQNLEISSVRWLTLSYGQEQPHSSSNSNFSLRLLISQSHSFRRVAIGLKKSL